MNYRMEKIYKRIYPKNKKFQDAILNKIYDETEQRLKGNKETLKNTTPLVNFILKTSFSPPFTVRESKILVNGEEKFKEVLKAIQQAKHHIHIQYYIFSDDIIGNKIKELLIQKAKEGVEVRFIFDDFGSHELQKKMYDELLENGVQVYAFYKIRFYLLANRINYRNHRKIIVIDSEIGFIGGINVSDRYINSTENSQKLFWRDTHLKLVGEAVNGLQFTFLNDWNFCEEKNIDYFTEKYFSLITSEEENQKVKENEFVQIVESGPDSDLPTIMLTYNGVICACKKRLYITTPYFIPNETILNSLKYAALSGVDVRILVPYQSDSKLLTYASSAYYEELLSAGIRIFRYKKGFVHAKTMLADDNISLIGSANFDMRSFDLNFEINAILYGAETNKQLYNLFLEDLNFSEEIDYELWKQRNKVKKFASSVAKLISPLL